MKKNNDNKKIKTETNIFFSLSLFVNLESCCIAWEANTTETKCEGAVKRLERWNEEEEVEEGVEEEEEESDKKIRPETYKK